MHDVSYGTFTIPFRKLDNGFKVVAPSIRGGGMIEVNEMRNWWNGYEMEDFFLSPRAATAKLKIVREGLGRYSVFLVETGSISKCFGEFNGSRKRNIRRSNDSNFRIINRARSISRHNH